MPRIKLRMYLPRLGKVWWSHGVFLLLHILCRIPSFFCVTSFAHQAPACWLMIRYLLQMKKECVTLPCENVLTRTSSLKSPSHRLHIHEEQLIFWSMRPSSAWRHIEMMTNWQASTGTHGETHTHTLLWLSWSPLKETIQGHLAVPRRSLVWQICIPLHFLHNSPCNGSKWPAWSPWISMSRVTGCVNLAWFDACCQLGC